MFHPSPVPNQEQPVCGDTTGSVGARRTFRSLPPLVALPPSATTSACPSLRGGPRAACLGVPLWKCSASLLPVPGPSHTALHSLPPLCSSLVLIGNNQLS